MAFLVQLLYITMWLIGEKADAMNWRSYLFYKCGLLYFYIIDIVDRGIVC